jgi:hypothetical protein
MVGEQRGQRAGDDALVGEQRGVGDGLEVDVAVDGRRPQDAGEFPGPQLLHRSGYHVAEALQRAPQERGPLHQLGPVLVLAQAAQQDGVHADELP